MYLFSAYSGRKIKSQYKKQPLTIRVVAYKNGSRERFAKIAAPTMKIVSIKNKMNEKWYSLLC